MRMLFDGPMPRNLDEGLAVPLVDDENGSFIFCDIVMTIDTLKCANRVYPFNYVVFTDGTCDEFDQTCIYAYTYDPDEVDPHLYPIETQEEWSLIEKILENERQRALAEEKLSEIKKEVEYLYVPKTFEYPKNPLPVPDPDLPFS